MTEANLSQTPKLSQEGDKPELSHTTAYQCWEKCRPTTTPKEILSVAKAKVLQAQTVTHQQPHQARDPHPGEITERLFKKSHQSNWVTN
ncbi:unnamed protein product [Acidithrix sp. C25]|nr:unnamed protein product [Acidithrix sp. C25]